MGDSRRTIQQLRNEMSQDLSRFAQDFTQSLRSNTPIRTGQARGGWTNQFRGLTGSGRTLIAKNTVGYIDLLQRGSSSQAPRGIIGPALNQTRKP